MFERLARYVVAHPWRIIAAWVMMLTGVSLLSEIGFAVASGIVLVAIVMASIFVPSVATLLGGFIWWPGHQPGRQLRDKAKHLVGETLHPPKLKDEPAAL